MTSHGTAAIVPELDVTHFERSLSFYTQIMGFEALYERPEEEFAYLALDDAHLMIESIDGPGRRLVTAPLEPPLGRGVNLQIRVPDVAALFRRVLASAATIIVPLEDRWYRVGTNEQGNRQFVVADPDGYVLRPFQSLGERTRRLP